MRYKLDVITKLSDFDDNDIYKEASIMDAFQEAAGIHASILDIGFKDLMEKDMIWVVSRSRFDVIRLPKPMEKIYVETWPLEKGRVDFDRNYLIKDYNGNVLVKGMSKWVVLNYKTRMLVRASEIDYPNDLDNEILYDDKFPKLKALNKDEMDYSYKYHIYRMDLDHNGHVNNAKYCNMAYNAINFNNRMIKSFQIDHIKEAIIGDEIDIYIKDFGDEIIVEGFNDELVFIVKYSF